MDDALHMAPLFAGLDNDAADALRSNMTEVELARGRMLFQEGDPGDALYVMITGKIKLVRKANDGRENLLAVLGPGEMFGELSVFDPGPRSTAAMAVTKVKLLRLSQADLVPWLHDRPEVAAGLLRQLAGRLRRTSETAADLVFTDVPGRVAKALLDLSQRFGTASADGLLVHHDLTQEELAQLVGASRETVNKALADFVARGWIKLEQKSVTLTDVERLRHRSR